MSQGESPAVLWSPSLSLSAAPPWVLLLFGKGAKNYVFFAVEPGPGPQYLMLGPCTTEATVCVFERGPLRRLVVLQKKYSTPGMVAGRTGAFRRFNIRRLFRLGISNEAWVRSAALLGDLPRFSAHMCARRLFLGPAVDLADDTALLSRVREVVRTNHFEVGVLPPPGVLVPLLLDPLLPPERGALEAGQYVPDLPPGGAPLAAAAVHVSGDGSSVVFGDMLTAITALGPIFAAGARGFVASGELLRLCRRHDVTPEDIPQTLAWAKGDMDGRAPTAVPIRVAYELLRHAAGRLLRRWAARVTALLADAVAPPVYSVRRKSSTSAPPGEAYTGRGRRVSVSLTSPDAISSHDGFTLVMDETGEASGLVPSEALVEIEMEDGCPGAGIDAEHKKHAEAMLGQGDGEHKLTVSAAGLVGKLPLCMTSQYRDAVTGVAVPLTDLRRFSLSKVLWGLRCDPAQRSHYAALLRADIASQGPLQCGRMVQVVTRTRAAGSIRPCSECQLSTRSTCFKALFDGKVAKVPDAPAGSTVVDLILEVKKANAERAERMARAAAQKEAVRSRLSKTSALPLKRGAPDV